MTIKKIGAVGLEGIVSDEIEHVDFASDASLSDWNIILFKPDFSAKQLGTNYAKELTEHWSKRLDIAIKAGKTVILFLPEVLFDPDADLFSSNYDCFPIGFNVENSSGKRMVVSAKSEIETYAKVLEQLSEMLKYRVLINDNDFPPSYVTPCLYTKDQQHVVGVLKRDKSGGTLIALPDIDRDYFYLLEDEYCSRRFLDDERVQEFTKNILYLDKLLRREVSISPPPEWAADSMYVSKKELDLQQDLALAEKKLLEAQTQKEKVENEINDIAQLRALLYAQGSELEKAIIKTLKILGFTAEGYDDGTYEFDAVFTAPEGRFIGEAEGKDNVAIDKKKLDQLHGNIGDDDSKSEANATPAKGILFGNGYRLKPPQERDIVFTQNCVIRSKVRNIALVDTRELFRVAQYLVDSPDDEDYKKQCRQALAEQTGILKFPDLPNT